MATTSVKRAKFNENNFPAVMDDCLLTRSKIMIKFLRNAVGKVYQLLE